MSKNLQDRFHMAMIKIYDDASAACSGYRPTRFKQLVVERGGLEAARHLLRGGSPASGFTDLFLCKRLDLSMEALVLKTPWNELFSPTELAEAKKRLDDVGFVG